MSITPGYFHRKQKENKTQKTSWLCSIPHLLISYTQQLEILATALVLGAAKSHKGKNIFYSCALQTFFGWIDVSASVIAMLNSLKIEELEQVKWGRS